MRAILGAILGALMGGYAVKEVFLTLQGEGAQAGRAAVFCRFAGCNLWSGREKDRSEAVCGFCDTDFVGADGQGGGSFPTAGALADAIELAWRGGLDDRFVVFTGGEPLLQLDEALIEAAHARGFEIAVETNGTQEPPRGVDWLCVSPKAGAPLVSNARLRAEAGISAGKSRSRNAARPRFRSFLAAADGWRGAR